MIEQIPRIGLLIHDLLSEYSRELRESLSDFCSKAHVALYIFPCGELKASYSRYNYQNRAVAAFINNHNLDGLIIAASTQGNYISRNQLFSYISSFNSIPKICIGVEIPGVHSVIVDCEPGLSSIVAHLVECHHCTKIAVLGVQGDSEEAIERKKVIFQMLKKYGLPADESIMLYGAFTYQRAQKAIENYVEEHGCIDFDALISLNDDMAYAFIDYAKEHGISIPHQVKLTGFDDIQRASSTLPTLTSVNQCITEQSRLAIEGILKLLRHEDVPMMQKVSSKALFRQTCGCTLESEPDKTLDKDGNVIDSRFLQNKTEATDWFRKKAQLTKIIEFQTDCQQIFSLDMLRTRFNQDFKNFDINGAALCLYEQPIDVEPFVFFPLPQKAELFTAFDSISGFETDSKQEPLQFNPNANMLPKDVLETRVGTYYVVALFIRSNQYGYLVFRPGNFDVIMYTILCNTFCNILASAFIHDQIEIEKQKLEERNDKLSRISRTDEMTQLLNRRGFMAVGQQALNIAGSISQSGLIIFGDMDGLKKINDKYGHDAGDRAIKAEAMLLQKVFRASDVIGRLGGDEFAIVAVGLTKELFIKIKNRLKRECRQWNKTAGEQFHLSISLGAAEFTPDVCNFQRLLQEADSEQYKEKRKKKTKRANEIYTRRV